MAVSKAQQKAVTKYVKTKYDRFGLTMPRGNLDKIKAHAETHGESVNGFIGRAIMEAMERDGAGGPQEAAEAAAGAGGIAIPPDALESAQQAAERTGETPAVFIARAIEMQAKRDKSSIALGINPAMGDKLEHDSKGIVHEQPNTITVKGSAHDEQSRAGEKPYRPDTR